MWIKFHLETTVTSDDNDSSSRPENAITIWNKSVNRQDKQQKSSATQYICIMFLNDLSFRCINIGRLHSSSTTDLPVVLECSPDFRLQASMKAQVRSPISSQLWHNNNDGRTSISFILGLSSDLMVVSRYTTRTHALWHLVWQLSYKYVRALFGRACGRTK